MEVAIRTEIKRKFNFVFFFFASSFALLLVRDLVSSVHQPLKMNILTN